MKASRMRCYRNPVIEQYYYLSRLFKYGWGNLLQEVLYVFLHETCKKAESAPQVAKS